MVAEERRQSSRVPFDKKSMSCRIQVKGTDQDVIEGRIENVSKTGFGILTNKQLPSGTDLRLTINGEGFDIDGIETFVVHSGKNDRGESYFGLALNFREGEMRSAHLYNRVSELFDELSGVSAAEP